MKKLEKTYKDTLRRLNQTWITIFFKNQNYTNKLAKPKMIIFSFMRILWIVKSKIDDFTLEIVNKFCNFVFFNFLLFIKIYPKFFNDPNIWEKIKNSINDYL